MLSFLGAEKVSKHLGSLSRVITACTIKPFIAANIYMSYANVKPDC